MTETTEYCFELPYPPTVNHYKKLGGIVKTKTGKLYQKKFNSPQTNKYYYDVYILTRHKMPAEWVKLSDSAIFSVKVYVHPPDDKKRDLDNICKVLLDSLVKAKILPDDSKIHRLYLEKCNIIEHGKVIVKIQEIVQ